MALHRMINAGAIIHGDPNRFLLKNECENPIALQLGGSDSADLAKAAAKAAQYGYDEINLNCGCPSPRVQKGAFGACLMNEVNLVRLPERHARCRSNCDITIKHRIGWINKRNISHLQILLVNWHEAQIVARLLFMREMRG